MTNARRPLPLWQILFPPFFLCFFFFLLTWPAGLSFSTHYFTDTRDGLQSIWSLWWIRKAVDQGTDGWFTDYLHYPYGVTLLSHSLAPLKGLMAVFLAPLMVPETVHNLLVIFSFILGGWGMFFLAYEATASFRGSLFAGFIYAFFNAHFAHTASGHIHMLSFEWNPWFLWAFWRWLREPRYGSAFLSAFFLVLIFHLSQYYFFQSVLSALLMAGVYAASGRNFKMTSIKPYVATLGMMLLIAGLGCGWVLIRMAGEFEPSGLSGIPNVSEYCMDVLAPWVPGGFWRWARLTEEFWKRSGGGLFEHSVFVGYSVLFFSIWGWFKARGSVQSAGMWLTSVFFFSILAWGPELHAGGTVFPGPWMPYQVMEAIFPQIKVSGLPVRLMDAAIPGIAVLAAAGFNHFFSVPSVQRRVAAIALLLLCFVEYFPGPMPLTRVNIPAYVYALKELPSGAVLDTVSNRYQQLYFQTVHEKPVAFGYVSRVPQKVSALDRRVEDLLERQEFRALREQFRFRYLVMPRSKELAPKEALKRLYADSEVTIDELIG